MIDEKRNFYTITEVLNLFNGTISRTQIHKYISQGKIKTISFGSKKLIYADWVHDILRGKGGIA